MSKIDAALLKEARDKSAALRADLGIVAPLLEELHELLQPDRTGLDEVGWSNLLFEVKEALDLPGVRAILDAKPEGKRMTTKKVIKVPWVDLEDHTEYLQHIINAAGVAGLIIDLGKGPWRITCTLELPPDVVTSKGNG